ncbi:MAG: GNAT family N-acetyltransferase [Candidatus Nanopelagicales bacterium]
MVDLPFPVVSAPPAPDAGVRDARPDDAAEIAAVQLAAWRQRYADVLPADALDGPVQSQAAEHWAASIAAPPSSGHHVLVATSGRLVVGYAVLTPGAEPADGEIADLEVHPDATRLGHASRLLSAAVDRLRQDSRTTVSAWCGEQDVARRTFLESTGMRADGVRRRLDMGEGTDGVDEVRLAARLD